MKDENIYNKIEELFGKNPDNFSILEDQIDIKTQMSYFEQSKKNKESTGSKEDILKNKAKLFSDDLDTNEKKELLVSLASVDDVEAYRIIEKYLEKAEVELKSWTVLALQESRMTIESSLLNENQVIISTGLGGKGKKLRYFAVLASSDNKPFTDLQKRLISKELEFALKKIDGEVEKIEFDENYTTLLAIVPLTISIKEVILSAVKECNEIGDFVSSKFILTNVKIFTIDEIKRSWKNITD